MATLDLCPQCRGKLTAISERTGGFSAGKAVVGAVVAGPVGVAAGALGKKLVTLQCTKCGYTIETDENTAREAVQFGEAYERYCNLHASRLPRPELPHKLPNPKEDKEMQYKGYLHREEEREKIGIDIEAVEQKAEQVKTEVTQELQPQLEKLQNDVQALEKSNEEKEKVLASLGFFKKSRKNALKSEIDGLETQIADARSQAEQLSASLAEQLKTRTEECRHDLVERCRILAYMSLDEYCFEEYREFATAIISVLGGEPMTGEEIGKALNSDMTGAQISMRLQFVGCPFISCTSTSPYRAAWFLGADGAGDKEFMRRFQEQAERGVFLGMENESFWKYYTPGNQGLLDKLQKLQNTILHLEAEGNEELNDILSSFETRISLLTTVSKTPRNAEYRDLIEEGIELVQEGIELAQAKGDQIYETDFFTKHKEYRERLQATVQRE